MTEKADVLARHGNVAVVHLSGRRFPAVTIQGDTFSTLVTPASEIAARVAQMGDAEVGGDAGYLRERLEELLQVYEKSLVERGIELPYFRPASPD